MDVHLNNKDLYCRLCCGKIKSKSRNVADFKKEIELLFSHDVDNDEPSSVSTKICESCRRKVERVHQGIYRAEPDNVAEFPNHTEEKCPICAKKVIPVTPFSVIKEDSLPLQYVNSVANKVGFVTVLIDKIKLVVAVLDLNESKLIIHLTKVVQIKADLTWVLKINGRNLDENDQIYKDFPLLNNKNLEEFFNCIKETVLCVGNNDFQDIIDDRLSNISEFKGIDGSIKALIENNNFQQLKDTSSTIRSVDCSLVVSSSSTRCERCSEFRRNTLNKIRYRKLNSPELPSKFKPNIYLTNNELRQKSTNLQVENKQLKKKIANLEKKLDQAIENDGVICQTGDHQFL
eukprot:TCONS_00029800-protein